MKQTIKTTEIQKGDFVVGYNQTVASVKAWELGKAGEIQITFENGSNIVTQKSWEMTVLRGER